MSLFFKEFGRRVKETVPETPNIPNFITIAREQGKEAATKAAEEYIQSIPPDYTHITNTLTDLAQACEDIGIKELPEEWQDFILDMLTQPNDEPEPSAKKEKQASRTTIVNLLLEKQVNGLFNHDSNRIVSIIQPDFNSTSQADKYVRNTIMNIQKSIHEVASEQDPKGLHRSGETLHSVINHPGRFSQETRQSCQAILDADEKYAQLPLPVLLNHLFTLKDRTKISPLDVKSTEMSKSLGIRQAVVDQVAERELVLGLDYYKNKKGLILTSRGQMLLLNAKTKAERRKIGADTLTKAINETKQEELAMYHRLENFYSTPELDYFLVSFFRQPISQSLFQDTINPYTTLENHEYPGNGPFNRELILNVIPQLEKLLRIITCSKKYDAQNLLQSTINRLCTSQPGLGMHTLNDFMLNINNLPENQKTEANNNLVTLAKAFIERHR
jgi:hypothetical protein